jgi:uncharacterized protein (DUF433 family)
MGRWNDEVIAQLLKQTIIEREPVIARPMETKLLQRITSDINICHGKPCVRGLRYPVEFLLELLSSGMTIDDILADYDDLERDDILAALLFAARLSQVKSIHKIAS